MKATSSLISLTSALLLAVNAAAQRNHETTSTAGSLPSLRLEWTQFVGGGGKEGLWALSNVDRDGFLWFTSATDSADFPTTSDAFDRHYHGGSQQSSLGDFFLAHFDTRQRGVVYATILGGATGPDRALNFDTDAAGNIYLVGNTCSADFPTSDDASMRQFQGPENRGGDGFLTILGDHGRKLRYSTFIGTAQNDSVTHVFVERSGEITLFGTTESPVFPAPEASRPAGRKEGSTLFVMRLDATAHRVLFSRVLANAFAVEVRRLDSGDFLIAGTTNNSAFPSTEGVYDRSYNGGTSRIGGDAFVMQLSADLNNVSFATLFGGSGEERAPKPTPVPGGDFFVAGWTTSKDLPVTSDALEKTMENKTAYFIARFSRDGRQLKYCSYLGGKGAETATQTFGKPVTDGRSRIYFSGTTTCADIPVTPDALQQKITAAGTCSWWHSISRTTRWPMAPTWAARKTMAAVS